MITTRIMGHKQRKVTQNMLLGLEIYEMNICRMPYREVLDMLWEYAGVTEEQLRNALRIIIRQKVKR